MPVWEISGAEFSQAEIHTANGISIRFPRVTKIRHDKDWKTATSLTQLIVSGAVMSDVFINIENKQYFSFLYIRILKWFFRTCTKHRKTLTI